MARVLVTGASGFIGRHLVKTLSLRNYEVACLCRERSDVSAIRRFEPELVNGDVTDTDSLRRAVRNRDLVINLAGVTKSLRARKMFLVNEQGAANVAMACASQQTPPVLIHLSSLAAAGPSHGDRTRNEMDCESPISNYGRSKLAGERAVLQFANRVPATILRPPIVFGEGDQDVFPVFKSIAKHGVVFAPPGSSYALSIVHASDLAEAIVLAASKGQRLERTSQGTDGQGVYFVAAAETPTFDELARTIGRILNRDRIRIINSSKALAWISGFVFEAAAQLIRKPFVLNWDKTREVVAGGWSCDATAIRQLGFAAAPLWNRLRQTADWYLQQGWLPAVDDRTATQKWRLPSPKRQSHE